MLSFGPSRTRVSGPFNRDQVEPCFTPGIRAFEESVNANSKVPETPGALISEGWVCGPVRWHPEMPKAKQKASDHVVQIGSRSGAKKDLKVKLDALGKRQLSAVVDCVGLATHIGLPSITPGFTAATGFFFTTKGPSDFCTAGSDVDVGNATIASPSRKEQLSAAQIGGHDG